MLCASHMASTSKDLKVFTVPFFNHSLQVVYSSQGLVEMTFVNEKASAQKRLTDFEKKIKQSVSSYFSKKSKTLDIPIDWQRLGATDFQKNVWQAMAQIPYGEVITYSELAQTVGSPKAARAVGSACAKNPIILVLPCHRVVSTQGLGGYSGGGLAIKRRLLRLEQSQ